MTVDVGADTVAVLVGLLTLAIALWAQIWRTGRGIRSDLNERMDGLESKVDDSTKLLYQLKGEVAGRRQAEVEAPTPDGAPADSRSDPVSRKPLPMRGAIAT